LNPIAELDMVAATKLLKRLPTIRAYWLADDTDPRPPLQGLYFPDKHQRLEIALVLPETGSKIGNPITGVGPCNLCAKHVGVLHVILFACEIAYRLYGKSAPFVGIQ